MVESREGEMSKFLNSPQISNIMRPEMPAHTQFVRRFSLGSSEQTTAAGEIHDGYIHNDNANPHILAEVDFIYDPVSRDLRTEYARKISVGTFRSKKNSPITPTEPQLETNFRGEQNSESSLSLRKSSICGENSGLPITKPVTHIEILLDDEIEDIDIERMCEECAPSFYNRAGQPEMGLKMGAAIVSACNKMFKITSDQDILKMLQL